MKNMKINFKKLLLICYIFVTILLYVLSLFIKLNIETKILYFTFILFNFISSVLLLIINKNKNNLLLTIAFFFTVIADLFLVLLQGNESLLYNKEIAMTSFIFVQSSYYYFIFRNKDNNKKLITDFLRFILIGIVILICVLIFKSSIDFLLITVCIYSVMLIFNIIDSIIYNKNGLFISGLILFMLCDICVGLTNASGYLNIPEYIINIITGRIDLVWLFYIPSQVLIFLSFVRRKGE